MDLRAERKFFEISWEPKKECGKFRDIECKQSPYQPQTPDLSPLVCMLRTVSQKLALGLGYLGFVTICNPTLDTFL